MCSLEFPDLETSIWQPYRDEGVQVLGLSGGGLFGQESITTITNFQAQTGVTFPLLLGDSTYYQYANSDGSISPYPLDVIVDKTGTIRYVRHQFDAVAMQQMVQQLLAE